MALTSRRSKRKISGGRYKDNRKKRIYEIRRLPALTKVGSLSKRILRILGGNKKQITLSASAVNLYDPKTKKYSVTKIENVLETPANRHFQRRNIMTKGTVIKTEKGKAKITSRPGQEGTINAVLIE